MNMIFKKFWWMTMGVYALMLYILVFYVSIYSSSAHASETGRQILTLEMTPAMCLLYPSRAQMRQCQEGYRMTVSSLDLGYDCLSSTTPVLSPVQEKVVRRIMPDDTFLRQAWRRHGACSPLSASEYFRLVTRYTSELKLPEEIASGDRYYVDKAMLQQKFRRLNPRLRIGQINFICQPVQQRSILTKIQICYTDGQGNCSNTVDTCPDRLTIWGNNG
ncbi:hypothetical protein [Psychrobacter sp. I-STPA6b]|uniref:hypothetical protein n=1 Tax=Psychrobacter sp. I-STPA6b TaxID=2585718 RepID=UPI001D0C8687|nr:hypothetical protein [Psychrobacter sp. I-STPA6b]